MARSRNIKPGFFYNEDLADVPPLGRLLFAGLWTLADRDGRLEDRIKKIKTQVLPYDDCDIDVLLDVLAEHGFIDRYVVDGKHYIQICKWHVHQNPHHKETASKIPAPDKGGESPGFSGTSPGNSGTSPADSLNLIPDSLNPLPPEPGPAPTPAAIDGQTPASASQKKSTTVVNTDISDFDAAWKIYPSRLGGGRKAALKAWQARIKDGVDSKTMLAGVRSYVAYVETMKTEQRFIKNAVNFLGPDEHYKEDWSAAAREAPAGKKAHGGKAGKYQNFDKIDYHQGIAEDGSF